MKKYLKPLLTGLLVTLAIILFMLKITMNFQILLGVGATIFFLAGLINSGKEINYLVKSLFIVIFYLTFFILLVLEELPVLWYFVPIYFASTLLGVLYKRYKQQAGISLLVLSAVILFVAFKLIPQGLENSLTKERFDELPTFTIQGVDGETWDSESFEGKIIVLDFFGTWCKPCVLELKELERIKAAFNEEEVEFFVINADQGGDTPEKFDAFIQKHNYTFHFAYDHDSQIFKQLKMHHLGLPTLLIIDKDQNIRLQHVGYNPAETHFTENMIEMINGLRLNH